MEKKKGTKTKSLMQMDIKQLLNKISIKKKTKKVKKPKFEFKKNVVAFDIGSKSIKIVEGTYYRNKLSIDKLIETATPEGSVVDGKILNDSSLMAALNYVLKDNGIKAKDAICTTNSSSIINRELIIPTVEEDELDTVVRYEIQQYLPINLQDYILQISVLEEVVVEDINKLSVRAVSYPERIANGYYKLLNNLNLKPYALDVNFNSLNKLVKFTEINKIYGYNGNDSVVFIDMGLASLDVNIYDNKGILDFTRIIKAGSVDIDEFLIQQKHITRKVLQQTKEEKINLNSIEVDEISNEIKGIVDEWIEKIEKVIQFYRNKNFNNEISNILIYGGTSNLKGLPEYMASKLGIKTTKINSLPKVTIKPKDVAIENYINAIGSIIRL